MVNCLRSGIEHSSSRRVVQAMTVFGCFLRFPHKDFIASIRIFFAMKCHPIEDIKMYFWLETKIQSKQPPGNSMQSYLFLVTKLSFGKTVARFSLSHFKTDLCMMTFTVFDRQCFHQDFKTSQESLKSSVCKFTVEPFVLRCH